MAIVMVVNDAQSWPLKLDVFPRARCVVAAQDPRSAVRLLRPRRFGGGPTVKSLSDLEDPSLACEAPELPQIGPCLLSHLVHES